MPYPFVTERLDVNVEQGAVGGPTFLTTVMTLASGFEKRNAEWSRQRMEWDLAYGIQTPDDLADVEALFYICLGQFSGFRFKDWTDYLIGNGPDVTQAQSIGTGNGTNLLFQIYKLYTISSFSYQRKITRVVLNDPSTTFVWVGGVLKVEGTDYTVNYDTGLITFVVAPGNAVNVALSVQFDVPVRFATDKLKKKVTWAEAEEVPAIGIIEVLE